MAAVYNEIDPAAAAWLRELIANNLIAPGDVDERSIKDVRADDYRGYDQVHCFAGIGIWSAAFRRSGWDDSQPVGSASCPCQGFSAAGKGLGFADPRHLWPDYLRLLDEASEQGQPWTDTVFIEQVASAGEWLNLVQLNLEDRGYAFGAADLPAAGFGQGAHIRQRFYGVADRHDPERWADLAGGNFSDWPQAGRIEGYGELGAGGQAGGLGGAEGEQRDRDRDTGRRGRQPSDASGDGGVGDGHDGRQPQRSERDGGEVSRSDRETSRGRDAGRPDVSERLGHHHPRLEGWRCDSIGREGQFAIRSPGLGGGPDWLLCQGGTVRPVEGGTFPLAPAHPSRVGLLRGYGNALDLETAVNFVSAYMEAAEIKDVMAQYA